MESSAKTCVPVRESDLQQYADQCTARLRSVSWTPKVARDTKRTGDRELSFSTIGSSQDTVSVLKCAQEVSRDLLLVNEDIHHVLIVVRKGMQIGSYLSAVYTKASGLDNLARLNGENRLEGEHKPRFRDMTFTAAAIAAFGTAYYVTWELERYKTQELSSVRMEFKGIPELSLQDPIRAIQCLTYYYGAYLGKSGIVKTPLDFIKLSQLYFQAVLDEIKMQEKSFTHTDAFTQICYKLADSEFSVSGFEVDLGSSRVSVEFNRVKFEEIVGNRDAKHKAMRLTQRLACFDPETKRNVMAEFKAIPQLRLGKGKPGTGKTMQIGLTATKLEEYCQRREVPFLYWPMPDTIVSTFQGGSAERMMDWMRPLRDMSRIIYAPIDDAEHNLEERTRQGVSAGVREVIAVFLRNTEGASVINRGNWAIELFTNIPDQLDRAVLSRVLDRFDIEGAITYEDFIDQDYLWWSKYKEYDESFVNMSDPSDYEYMVNQKSVQSLSIIYMDAHRGPTEPRLREIFDRVKKQYKLTNHSFFGKLYAEVQKEFPFFSSRDARNIQHAVNERVMDFDLPEEWFDNLELFFRQPYERQRAMVVELMRQTMKGLSFAEIRLQEASRYLDTTVSIMDQGRERQITERILQLEIDIEARRRLLPAA